MKPIHRIITALGLSLCLLGMSGCSDAAMGTDALLRPPRATGDKAEIQDIIAQEAGGIYTLKYPQNGDNRSAIIMRNENTDDEYALALYSTENDTKLNVSVIAYREEKWVCIGTFSNNAAGVDRVIFEDISGDKKEEVIIGWTNYNSSHKSLTGYSLTTEGAFEMKVDETYDELVITDLVGDMTRDLVLLSLSTQDTPSAAVLLQYSEKDKKPIAKNSMELDPDVISFSNIYAGSAAVNTVVNSDSTKDTGSSARAAASRTESDEESGAVSGGSEKSQPSGKPEGSAEQDESDDSTVPTIPEETSGSEELSKEETENSEDSEVHEPEVSVQNGREDSEAESSAPEESSNGQEVIHTSDEIRELNRSALVLDCVRRDNTYCTQMVYYDKYREALIDPIISTSGKQYSANPTIRVDAIFSRDINNDTVIDIPIVTAMAASVEESGGNVCNMTSWMNYDAKENELTTVYNTVLNSKDGYCFIMPDRWNQETVTARSNPETRELSFYCWDSKHHFAADKLLTISRLTEQQWKDKTDDSLFRIEVPDAGFNAVYAASVFEVENEKMQELEIGRDEVQKAVKLL